MLEKIIAKNNTAISMIIEPFFNLLAILLPIPPKIINDISTIDIERMGLPKKRLNFWIKKISKNIYPTPNNATYVAAERKIKFSKSFLNLMIDMSKIKSITRAYLKNTKVISLTIL